MADFLSSNTFSQSSASAGGCPQVVSSTDMRWFVMRATYSRELKVQKSLQEEGIECFVPMVCKRDENGKRYVPAIHNLVFVHTSREFMDAYKRRLENVIPLQYMMDRSTGLPMVVRDKEMEDFMRVTSDREGDIKYLDNPDVVATKGIPVEVMIGPYKGIQGKLLRIRKDRKVVLQLAGFIAMAVDGIPMEWCKVIEG